MSMRTNKSKMSCDKTLTRFSVLSRKLKNPTLTSQKRSKQKVREEAIQNLLPFHSIRNGTIKLTNGNYISCLEIYPLAFFEKTIVRQNLIIKNYKSIFVDELSRAHFITLCDKSNPEELLTNVYTQCKHQKNPVIAKRLEDYAQFVRALAKSGTVSKRFFIIYEYQGDDNSVKSHNRSEIEETMYNTRQRLIHIMMQCGNACRIPTNYDSFLYEFLYMYFNRNSYLKEPLNKRMERLNRDFKRYNELHPDRKRYITLNDIIGSKGLYFTNKGYLYSDGLYFTYIALRADTWPSRVTGAWTNNFLQNYSANLDLHIITDKVNEIIAGLGVNQVYYDRNERYKNAVSKNKGSEKILNLSASFKHASALKRFLDAGDDVFDCLIIIAIRGDSPKQIANIRRTIIKSLSKFALKFECSYLNVKDYYNLTLPCIDTQNRIFRKHKHNVTTTTMGDFYNYTAREVIDTTGSVIGQADNLSLLGVDNFNTTKYTNPHILILGTSGAGKTYLEQILGTRKLLMGERVFFIIPKKAHEYKGAVEMCDGSYIKLGPGSNQCINILEIRPEGEIDLSKLDNDIQFQNMSWLSRKIGMVILWLQIRMNGIFFSDAQYSKIAMHLANMYNRFGITHDNSSIFNLETGELKKMPILSDLVAEFKTDKSLDEISDAVDAFIKEIGRNMNQQTNVDLDNDFIVYDIDEDDIGERYLASYLFIAFQNVYDVVKSNISVRDNVVLDEVWKLMATEVCAKQIQNMIKILRGYNACAIIATQEMKDFFGKTGDFGISVLSNSRIIILLGMNNTDADLVKNTLKLTPEDIEKIIQYQRGEGMLITNQDKIHMYIIPSGRENEYFEKYTSSGKDKLIR